MHSKIAAVRLIAVMGLAAGLSAPVVAEAADRRVSVTVMDVKATGFDSKSAAVLGSLIASELSNHPIAVSSESDLKAMAEFEKQQKKAGCAEPGCQPEAPAAGDYQLVTEVKAVKGGFELSLSLLETAKGTALKQVAKKAKSSSDVVDVALEAVRELSKALPAKPPAPAAKKDAAAKP